MGSSRDWAAKGVYLLASKRSSRQLRAHPSQQSGRHGRAAIAIPARANRASLGLTVKASFEIQIGDDLSRCQK